MAFNNPNAFWFLLFIPGILLIWGGTSFLIRRDNARFADIKMFALLSENTSKSKRVIRAGLFLIGMLFLILALTGPRFGTKTEIVRRMGVDLIIALDTSSSMLAEDIKPNRIRQSKYEIARLIDHLQGDRVALIAFSGKSFVQCPLTTDYGSAKTLLESIDVGIIPVPGTNLGEALNGAFSLLKKGSAAGGESQLIILFTDGENLSGNYERAAKAAASNGIRIFTVGIGTQSGEIIPIRDENGEIMDYKKDKSGNVVKTSLNEEALKNIARLSGGMYLHTDNGEVDIQEIIDRLGYMHKSDIHERKVSRLKERYQLPLGIALVFLLPWLLLSERKRNY